MSAIELPKNYDPHAVEDKWLAVWDERGYFSADPNSQKPKYAIVIPPPNVTGVLHLGHALNNTLQDIMIRYNEKNLPKTGKKLGEATLEEMDVLWEKAKRSLG